ncbi:MAG: hypothetical protein N3A66_07005, partial [Planctomycetota bacterium]|nr:hypothetical protein [Planctomycetota bacterium]
MAGWLALAVPLAILAVVVAMVVRYFFWQIEEEIRAAARLENDRDYRAAVLSELDARVAQSPQDCRLRLRRADVRRLHGDHQGAISDLEHYLAFRPDDDAGWAEMAESHLAVGKASEALLAAGRARRLDPACLDYHRLAAGAALQAKNFLAAEEAIALWQQAEEARLAEEQRRPTPRMLGGQALPPFAGDPLLPWYRAALALARGQMAQAQEALALALAGGADVPEEVYQDKA